MIIFLFGSVVLGVMFGFMNRDYDNCINETDCLFIRMDEITGYRSIKNPF